MLFLSCFRARLFIDALLSPAEKGRTCWLSFVITYCEIVTFPLLSWVRCGARFLSFALFRVCKFNIEKQSEHFNASHFLI